MDNNKLETRLFDVAVDLLRKADRRDFYPRVVEFCADLLQSEVCALYIRTEQIDGKPRVCLVAGKLPPEHPKGQRMNPIEVDPDPRKHSYEIGIENESGEYNGVTGRIVTTGEPVIIHGYDNITQLKGHIGKWDEYVWQGRPSELFKCMLGVAIKNPSNKTIIGVIKVENKVSGEYTQEDENLLTQIGTSLSQSLLELIREKRELSPAIEEYQYRVPRSKPKAFEKEKTGEVIIKHSMTAICHSDIYYFNHSKSKERLDERLPLVLGHETTGEVYHVLGENQYQNDGIIQQKDRVVVIPLIPCGTCKVCKENYGENYCPSSRFMASNAPGSLRTVYKYYPKLILKINNPENEMYALFTEPMSNVVQILQELGFGEDQDHVDLKMAPFRKQEFNYFHVRDLSFTNIFDSITAEEPFPRTLFLLRNPNDSPLGYNNIRHRNLMIKGLGLLGVSKSDEIVLTERKIDSPKVLILGGGTIGYILAMLLSVVFKLQKDKIVVTGRDPEKLAKFKNIATNAPIGSFLQEDGRYDWRKGIVKTLKFYGAPGLYDIVFECVGWPAVDQNIDLALRVLKNGGVLALEGITDQSVSVDFNKIIKKDLFIKGFYRGSINAYKKSLEYIEKYEQIRTYLEKLVDHDTEVNGQRGFHRVENEEQLAKLFSKAESKGTFGRLIINELL
jgi:threonine dehydrogenase-like Zn-dependent dehydrogenase